MHLSGVAWVARVACRTMAHLTQDQAANCNRRSASVTPRRCTPAEIIQLTRVLLVGDSSVAHIQEATDQPDQLIVAERLCEVRVDADL